MAVTRDLTKIQGGPCAVEWNDVPIGHTQDGVELSYEPDIRERVVDEYGSTAVDLLLIGESLTVTLKFTQWELANFKVAIPVALDGTTYLGIGRKAGYLFSSVAKELRIHPLELADAVTTYDVKLWKAVPNSPVAIGWNNEGDRVFEVTFKALPDTTKADGRVLGQIGAT